MKHVLSVLTEHKPGVVSRISGLFGRRGYNLHSIAACPTKDPEIYRFTIVVHGDHAILEQITKQLNKLIDVIKVVDFKSTDEIVDQTIGRIDECHHDNFELQEQVRDNTSNEQGIYNYN